MCEQDVYSAASLSANSPVWTTFHCTVTAKLIARSLVWSPFDLEAHALFPPAFRYGVRKVCLLAVRLVNVNRGLPHLAWLLVITRLPRDWDFTSDSEHAICVLSGLVHIHHMRDMQALLGELIDVWYDQMSYHLCGVLTEEEAN